MKDEKKITMTKDEFVQAAAEVTSATAIRQFVNEDPMLLLVFGIFTVELAARLFLSEEEWEKRQTEQEKTFSEDNIAKFGADMAQ